MTPKELLRKWATLDARSDTQKDGKNDENGVKGIERGKQKPWKPLISKAFSVWVRGFEVLHS